MRPHDDPSWGSYPETILELHLGGGVLRVDLRERVPSDVVERLASSGHVEMFGVVTPDNPRGRERDEALNAGARAELEGWLRPRGIDYVRADGVSPGGLHREVGFAVWCELEAVREVAREWGQSAFFWFDGAGFWIEGALVEAEGRRLPVDGA